MKHLKIIFWVSPLFLILFFFNQEPAPQHERQLASVQGPSTKYVPQKIIQPRSNRSFKAKRSIDKFLVSRIPQSVESTFKKDFSIKLTRGHVFLKNIGAIAKEKYDPSLGETVHQDDLYVYFRSKGNHSVIPVAMMTSTNKLYPISSILHVKGATEEIRRELINSGLTQYYYHAPIKLLSIDSSGENVLKIYSDLERQGHKVELEVLKPMPEAL